MGTETRETKRDRVYCEASQLEIYRELAGTSGERKKESRGGDTAPFNSLKDVFLMATCLGVKSGKRVALKQRREVALRTYFNEHRDMAVLRAIAVAETNGVDVIGDENEVLGIAEEYANGGLEDLKRSAWQVVAPLQHLVQMIIQAGQDESLINLDE